MKLIAETDAVTERRYQIAFEIITRFLGIEHLPQTVWLSFIQEGPEAYEIGFGRILRKKIGGETVNDVVDGYVQMRINLHRSTCKCSACQEENAQLDPLSTFCHEMVHVKQLLRSELRRTSNGIWWRGHFYTKREVPKYQDQPWEHEANRLQAVLTPMVKAALATTA